MVGWWDLFAILCKFMLENFTLAVSYLHVYTANEDCLQVTYVGQEPKSLNVQSCQQGLIAAKQLT